MNHSRQRRHQTRFILIIRMHHHHNVRPALQRQSIARLLIPSVTKITFMDVDKNSQLTRSPHRLVPTRIIHQNYIVHHLPIQRLHRLSQGLRRIIGRHHHGHSRPAKHLRPYPTHGRRLKCKKGARERSGSGSVPHNRMYSSRRRRRFTQRRLVPRVDDTQAGTVKVIHIAGGHGQAVAAGGGGNEAVFQGEEPAGAPLFGL